MPKYIAFLRAINVGGHTVKMDELRRLFQGMGFSNVETFIASGNVIFDSTSGSSKALEKKIEDSLRKSLGYEVRTFIRSPSELVDIVAYKPFAERELKVDGNLLFVAFMASEPTSGGIQKLTALRTKTDDFHVFGRETYWLRRMTEGESTYSGQLIEKALGVPATVRNSTTVKKLAAKYRG
jgi:uncharacterized protein (DUF1697 family)